MATPSRPEPLHNIKSAARKLPIKRRPPHPSDPLTPRTPFSIIVDDGDGDGDVDGDCDVDGEFPSADPSGPFKFQRIWSEADELRFLRGLLACHSQGMLFPRDLNAFFDRFSLAMPQPYSRSQLSEKLRRLRKKYRIASSRVLRGMDPSALSPHDRDLYDLSLRLWDPAFSHSSPFSSSGPHASKRRRRLPPPPSSDTPPLPRPVKEELPEEESPVPNTTPTDTSGSPTGPRSGPGEVKHAIMRTLLDVFESALKEVKTSEGEVGDLARRWEEQRVLELNVLAGRMRLGLEDALRG